MNRFKAILFLLTFTYSLVGYNIEVHYCGSELTDISVLGNSKCHCDETAKSSTTMGCHESSQKKQKKKGCCDHSKSDKSKVEKKDCCKTEYFSVDIDETITSVKPFSVAQLAIIFVEYGFHKEFLSEKPDLEYLYSPPKLVVDIQVMVQSFLI